MVSGLIDEGLKHPFMLTQNLVDSFGYQSDPPRLVMFSQTLAKPTLSPAFFHSEGFQGTIVMCCGVLDEAVLSLESFVGRSRWLKV